MKKLIAFIVALVSYAAAYLTYNSKKAADQRLNEELREYRKIQAENDIITLQRQLSEVLLACELNVTGYSYQSQMMKQSELLNKMYARI